MKKHILILIAAVLASAIPGAAQVFDTHHPTYFVGGVPAKGKADANTSDLKFQIATAVPILHDIGGRKGLDVDFTYRQVSVWNFFADSSPFKDHSFMPGLRVGVPVGKDILHFGIEHRSNGRNDGLSRSVNYVYANYSAYLECGIVIKGGVRGGFGWYDETMTQALFSRFYGYADLAVGYGRGPFEIEFKATPLAKPSYVNFETAAAYHIGRFAIFVQYNNGYGEALSDWVLDAARPVPHLRFGILLGRLL